MDTCFMLSCKKLLAWVWKKIFFSILAEEMLHAKDYFKHGKLDKDGLVNFIKDVKKNTKLSDEDAAILAASKWV